MLPANLLPVPRRPCASSLRPIRCISCHPACRPSLLLCAALPSGSRSMSVCLRGAIRCSPPSVIFSTATISSVAARSRSLWRLSWSSAATRSRPGTMSLSISPAWEVSKGRGERALQAAHDKLVRSVHYAAQHYCGRCVY